MSLQPLSAYTIAKRLPRLTNWYICNSGNALAPKMVLDENLENAGIHYHHHHAYVNVNVNMNANVLQHMQVHSSNDAFYHRQIVTAHLWHIFLPAPPEGMVRMRNNSNGLSYPIFAPCSPPIDHAFRIYKQTQTSVVHPILWCVCPVRFAFLKSITRNYTNRLVKLMRL